MPAPPRSASILEAIGNTPLVRLRNVVPAGCGEVWLKLEGANPSGSHKDRMALAVIEGAEARGELKPGMRVVEYTGGSTGSSLAMICAAKGYRFEPLSSDAFAAEKLKTMRAFGAELKLVNSDGGQITAGLFDRMKREIKEMAAQADTFYADQFNNPDVCRGYMSMGAELVQQLGPGIDAFCAAFGSGGMLMGVSRALKASGCAVRVVGLEPAGSPVLTEGWAGAHHVEGIGVGFVPPHLCADDYDELRAVEETVAGAMARRLAREEGILAGTSTGLNVAGAVQLAWEYGLGSTIVTVACDTGLKYLTGDLFARV